MPLPDPADEAFRQELRQFLAQHLSDDLRQASRRNAAIFADRDTGQRWTRILAARGWSVPHWPVAWGGTGWTPQQHDIFASELAAADAPVLAPQGARMVAPVLLAFGTPAQQQQWLPGIRSGDDHWAQGYSEPGAGSDLASLQCRATRVQDAQGEGYVIDGTKIWTTHAHWANKMFCLVRTHPAAKAQQGISFLLFDMHLPGITVRPILSMSGDHELNQVFFDAVRVPATALLGEENQGWTIAKYLLLHERGGTWAPMLRARWARLHRALDAAFAGRPPHDDERRDLAHRLVDAQCRIDALHALEQQVLADRARGDESPIAPSIGKLLGTELKQHLTEIGIAIAGADAALRPVPEAGGATDSSESPKMPTLALPDEPVWAMSAYLNDRAASIYGGTNEVQRNLIARHLLAH